MLADLLKKLMSGAPKSILNFGSGVLGWTAPVVGAGVLVLGAIAIATGNIWIQLALALGVVGLVAYFIHKAFGFAHDHPDHSLLGGANLVAALKLAQAAKDPKIIEGESFATENVDPPKAISSGGA